MVANRELSEKQKEKVEKEINYMFYELYTKRIYGGIQQGTEIIKIITDFLPAGKAAKVFKTIKESWNNKGGYSKSVTTQTAE